jgi:DSF synthase
MNISASMRLKTHSTDGTIEKKVQCPIPDPVHRPGDGVISLFDRSAFGTLSAPGGAARGGATFPGSGFEEIDVSHDPVAGTLWYRMRPLGRPCFSLRMLREIRELQARVTTFCAAAAVRGAQPPIRHLVLGSTVAGTFNLGGDLAGFAQAIRSRDAATLQTYADACVDVLHPNATALGLPLVTVALVQGDALGGGFEAALSSQVLVAERGTRFGMPEILFNLIPGMGAYSFLSRRIGPAAAEKMILGGAIHTAEELHELGVVDVLADQGRGEEAVREFLREFDRKSVARRALLRAREAVAPVTREELQRIVDLWVEAALSLSEADVRRMAHLVAAQDRRRVRQAAS